MNFASYADIWRIPAVRQAIILGGLGKAPWFGAGLILTLHVVGRLGQTYSAAGAVTAVFTLAIALASPWRGRLLDTVGLRRTLLPSLIVLPVIFAFAPFVDYWPLLIGMGVVGAFAVPWFVVTRQMVIAGTTPEQRRTAIALDSVVTEIAFIVGPTLGVLAAVYLDTGWSLTGFALASVVAAGILWWKNPPLRSEVAPGGQRGGVRTWLTWPVIAVYVATAAATFTLAGTDLAIVASVRAMDAAAMLAVILAFWGVGSLVGGLLYGSLEGRHVPVTWLVLALGATTIPAALATDPWVLTGLVTLAGFFCAPTLAASAEALSHEVPEGSHGEAMGWQGTVSTLGNAAAPPLVGFIIDAQGWHAGFAWTGALGVAAALVGAALIALGRRYTGRRRAAALP